MTHYTTAPATRAQRAHTKQFVAWTLLLAILLSALPARPAQAAAPQQEPLASSGAITDVVADRMTPLELTLATDGPVGPGGVATLTLEARTLTDAPNVHIQWFLPEGGELAGGSAEEESGPVVKGQTVRSQRQVRFPAEGVFRVMASALIAPSPSEQYAPLGVIFFDVRSNGAQVSTKDITAIDPRTVPMQTEVAQLSASAAEVDPASPDAPVEPAEANDPCFTISGRVQRIERRPISTMLGAAQTVPVANAVIAMREEDTLFDDEYGRKLTNANGNYSFSFCDDDGVFDDELELYIRLRAQLNSGGKTVVEVEDSSYIDEVYEFDSSIIESEGGSYTLNFTLNEEQSGIFNIADAVFQAWSVWNESGGATGDDAIFDEAAEVHWEKNYGDTGSYYQSFWGEMTIADDPSDPDQWDDSVIMHEWGHMADDEYGCDDNGGGPHNIDTLTNDRELSWGEGYPDYYQSAVRAARGYADASFYLDMNGAGVPGISVNLETYDSTRPANLLSDQNELAIAAMLWDFTDSAQDGRTSGGGPAGAPVDRVAHGHTMVQRAYTDPTFEANGDVFDDTCTAFVYILAWRQMGLPTDSATAETITKNIGLANPFGTGGSAAAVAETAGAQPAALNVSPPSGGEDYQWWKRLTMVVDNSASMAGPKIDGIKTVATEQTNDAAQEPKGTQFKLFTFDNTANAIKPFFKDYFTAGNAATGINALTPGAAADPNCVVNGLGSLAQGAQTMRGGQAWLYTDGDSYASPSAANMRQLLTSRGVRGSVVLLGGCSSLTPTPPNVSATMKAFMGLGANASQPTGIVPYLLTALGSGGQFFYVNPAQIAQTGDVLRAQLGHSAGAGRWSDYVSDKWTYRWDKMDPPDYQWFEIGLSQDAGVLSTYLDVPMKGPVWGDERTVARVYPTGYIQMNPCTGPFCTLERTYLNNLYNPNLTWAFVPFPPNLAAAADAAAQAAAAELAASDPNGNYTLTVPISETVAIASPDAPQAACYFGTNYGQQAKVYTANFGINEWHIVTTVGEALGGGCRAYQVWLNENTGEIRYQYQQLQAGDSGGAQIGVRRTSFLIGGTDDEVIVSNNDVAGATNGTGYIFTPAPPQPTRTHTATVDSLIDSIGFLQTGFSGNFEPLLVRTPDGNTVDCNASGVLCLTVDNAPGDRSVQYVQVDVNGRTGVWSATVDAGSSGSSTYSFTSLAASELEVQGTFDHAPSSFAAFPLKVNMGRAMTGNVLTGWLQTPNGSRWGNEFTLYDDGAHGDGQVGDGQFALPDFTGPGRGVGYLWLRGQVGGETIQRMDPAPINFQPFSLTVLNPGVIANDGSPFNVTLRYENRDSRQRCFTTPDFTLPQGWLSEWSLIPGNPCLNYGQSADRTVKIYPNWDAVSTADAEAITAARSGAQATVTASTQDQYDDAIADSVSFTAQYFRPAAQIFFDDQNFNHYLRPNGTDTVDVVVRVLDDQGMTVADGTPVAMTASAGFLAEENLVTQNGRVATTYTAPNTVGDVTLTATTGALSATAIVKIRNPIANTIQFTASPTNLGEGLTSELVATVLDDWGTPVPGARVRIGVEGDGQTGLLVGGEVVEGVSNAQGQLSTTFTKAKGVIAPVGVRAQLLSSGGAVLQEQRLSLTSGTQRWLYLPVITK